MKIGQTLSERPDLIGALGQRPTQRRKSKFVLLQNLVVFLMIES